MRCYRCMKEFPDGYSICPHCGYDMDSTPEVVNHLYPGTVLGTRYVIGTVIGAGGFGVTYKAWDKQLDTLVCIKEYFPCDSTNRVPGEKDVIIYSGRGQEEFAAGLDRFLDEAQNMAKFSKHENVVNVYNYFEENNTAYIVMEYLEGRTLKECLIDDEGYALSMEPDKAMDIFISVCNALKAIHGVGIIHRDIAPDNIFILKSGRVKVLDFGAARLSVRTEQSRFITLKPGYAPQEQYRQNGNQGTWTDIYALGATMYRVLTGEVPLESTDRAVRDELKEPANINNRIPDYVNNAIMRAMAVNIDYRFKNVEEFEAAMTNQKQVLALEEEIKRRKKTRFITVMCSVFFIVFSIGFLTYRIGKNMDSSSISADLEVWLCCDEDEDADKLKQYYEKAFEQVFLSDFKNVKIDLKVFDKSEYTNELIKAISLGNAPDVFESTDVGEDVLKNALELDSMVEKIKSDGNKQKYYFLNSFERNIPDRKRLPVGWSIPVAYSVGRDYKEKVAISELYGNSEDHLTEDAIKKLNGDEQVYVLGNSTDYEVVREHVYGTYENVNKNISGKLNLSIVEEKMPDYTTTFSVSNNLNKKEIKAVNLFLEYLLSYREQHLLHSEGSIEGVNESDAFSVNIDADDEYRKKIRSTFSILDSVIQQYK